MPWEQEVFSLLSRGAEEMFERCAAAHFFVSVRGHRHVGVAEFDAGEDRGRLRQGLGGASARVGGCHFNV